MSSPNSSTNPRRARPSQVNTDFQPQQQPTSLPDSATSASTATSESQMGSPIMSPDTAVLSSSSALPSPEHPGKDFEEQFPPAPLQLPDALLSQKTSSSSLCQRSVVTSPNPNTTTSPVPAASSSFTGPSLIRRISTKAQQKIAGKRRPSITAQNSRDGSVGPGLMRRRSDSNNTASDFGLEKIILTDSDEDPQEREEYLAGLLPLPGPQTGSPPPPPPPPTTTLLPHSRESATTNFASSFLGAPASASSSTVVSDAPVIPSVLKEGTPLRKVSKKNKAKEITLRLQVESHSNKISWNKSKPHKCIQVDDIQEIRTGSDVRQYRQSFGFPESEDGRWFSIIYVVGARGKTKTMHLIAPNDVCFADWTETLDAISRHRQFVMSALMKFDEEAVRNYWMKEMADRAAEKAADRAPGEEELDLEGIQRVCRSLHINLSQPLFKNALGVGGTQGTASLDFAGFMKFLGHLKRRQDINRVYKDIASNHELGLTLDEFLGFLREKQREDVDGRLHEWEMAFARHCDHRNEKDAAAATTAATTATTTAAAATALVATSPGEGEKGDEGEGRSGPEPRMSDAGFASFLCSPDNSLLKEPPANPKLDRPMNEYFISSSHNTYLLGRQVYGVSTVEGYINALVNGCRCVEVDCWDGPNGQPIVNHGRTFTAAISFQEVITTINKYAFDKSRLPLWISFEVHCSAAQQAEMTSIVKNTFGSRLVTEPLHAGSRTLPSPSELLDRILIKVKQAPRTNDNTLLLSPLGGSGSGSGDGGRKRGSSLTSSSSSSNQNPPVIPELSAISQSVPPSPILSPSPSTRRIGGGGGGVRRVNTIAEGEVRGEKAGSINANANAIASVSVSASANASTTTSDNDSGAEKEAPNHHQRSFTAKIIKSLGALGVYCAGVKFKGFDTAEAKEYNHVFSFMETNFAWYSRSKEDRKALDRHNMRYMMRVYPNQTRVKSNNFDPLIYWRRGVQMAALNWQTFDLGAQLNRAMFEGGTDSSGYVLKPKELREIRLMPGGWAGKRERQEVKFTIEVISAQQLIRPASLSANKTMNPYVEIDVFHASDKRDKESISGLSPPLHDGPTKVATEPVMDNGFDPTWGGAKNTFPFRLTTKYADLIFVRFTVKLNPSGATYAVYTAKLMNLKQGYRTVPLLSPTCGQQYLFSTLFCRISIDSIESVLLDHPDDRPETGNKLRGLGRNVFTRSMSPKSSTDKQFSDRSPSLDQ